MTHVRQPHESGAHPNVNLPACASGLKGRGDYVAPIHDVGESHDQVPETNLTV